MITIDTLTTFFGWCTAINIGLFLLTLIRISAFRGFAISLNARIFAISEDEVRVMIFRYIALYKLAITVFCFAPWLALTLMNQAL